MSSEIHIASLVIQIRPQRRQAIIAMLSQLPENEILTGEADNKLVFVFEASSAGALQETIDAINEMEGVLAANLVYHHHESPSSLAEEIDYAPHAT